ncbi:MAG: radical SAM family heme chaperone HemW, partial [Sphingomonadales bacterium]
MGIYIHWPFCLNKCPYCDFNSHVRDKIDQDHFLKTYYKEIDNFKTLLPNAKTASIFFGGGTPSLMEPRLVEGLIHKVLETWPAENNPEITLEANPSSVEANRFKGYREAGVNRVSLGIQALRNDDLKSLGRWHNVREAKEALEIAKKTFSRVSFDLIYARPNQSFENWRLELKEALLMAEGHLSLYQLTIEDGTAFAQAHKKGRIKLPEENLARDLYNLTQDMCEENGLPAYEVSNHARPGQESQHNLIYWKGFGYLGLGPGAHGRLPTKEGMVATALIRKPEGWLNKVEETGTGLIEQQLLSSEDRAVE